MLKFHLGRTLGSKNLTLLTYLIKILAELMQSHKETLELFRLCVLKKKNPKELSLHERMQYGMLTGNPNDYDIEMVLFKLRARIKESLSNYEIDNTYSFFPKDLRSTMAQLLTKLGKCEDEGSLVTIINENNASKMSHIKCLSNNFPSLKNKQNISFSDIKLAVIESDKQYMEDSNNLTSHL